MEARERRLVGGRFEVLETVGRGAMGVVYRARDRERGSEVALKTLSGITPESILRFKAEFRALRDVRHPNLVELGELFENEGTWFFTMELVRGVELLSFINGRTDDGEGTSDSATPSSTPTGLASVVTSIDEDATEADAPTSVTNRTSVERIQRLRLPRPCCDIDRLRIALAGLARGLAALHKAGKVHRDVKPSNVLVEENGRVALLDFGIVAELHQATRDRRIFGTIKYMAPEQARGEVVGPEADWYAFGVLLYQSLTGRSPFSGHTLDEVLVLKQHVDPTPPHELVDHCPADLDRLACGLLDRNPSHRPSEGEIFEALGISPGEEVPDLPRSDDPLFVGRHPELAMIDAAWVASRRRGVCVLVEGESGVGKTTLVQRFIALARGVEKRTVVLRGRCHERERVPFNAVDGVIDDLAKFLASIRDTSVERVVPQGVAAMLAVFPALRVVPVLSEAAAIERPMPGVDTRGVAFVALRELLVRLSKRRPVIIAIDDLQWADVDSAALLEEILGPGEQPRICMLATKRPQERNEIVQRLRTAGADVRAIELGGLDRADAEELVRLVGQDAGVHAESIVADTRGHPLFLRELARHPSAGAIKLEDAIWMRAAKLDDTARRLLAVTAVAAAPIPRHVAFDAAGLQRPDAEARLAALVGENLVRAHGPLAQDTIETYHDRIRAAVVARIDIGERRAIHGALAQALEASGAPAETLLAQFDAAGDHARAAIYIVAAADAARSAFAFGRAAELYTRALGLPGLASDQRVELFVQLAESLSNDGRTGEAAERYLEAAALVPADSDRQLDLLRRGAERFLMAGRLNAGFDTARAVLARVGMTLPSSLLRTVGGIVWNQVRMRELRWSPRSRDHARSLHADICWSIGAGLGMVDTLRGAYFSTRAARLSMREGSALQIARGMSAATVGASLLGRRVRAHNLLDAARRAAAEDGTPLADFYVGLAKTALAFTLENDFRTALTSARETEATWYAAGQGPGWETDVTMHFALSSQMMLCEHRDLARRVATLAHAAKRKGDLFQEITLRVRFAIRHLIDNQYDAARADVADALAAWLPGSDTFGNQRAWALWSRTRIEMYAGNHDAPGLEADWKRMHRSLVGRVPLMQAEWMHCYATYLLGRALDAKKRGLASEHLAFCRDAERVADRYKKLRQFPAAPAADWLIRAGVAWTRGDGDRVEMTRRALDAHYAAGMYAMAPGVKRRLGEAIGGDEGAALIEEADREARKAGWIDPQRFAELAIPTDRYT